MKTTKEVIVVEGVHDEMKIKKALKNIDVVITRGHGLSKVTLNMLKKLNETRGLILMLDPDYPGEQIRAMINQYVGETKHIFLRKRDCQNRAKTKVGIEHASVETLRNALSEFILKTDRQRGSLTMNDMVELKLTAHNQARKNRDKLAQHFGIGVANAKTTLRRLNMFAIDSEAIKKVIL